MKHLLATSVFALSVLVSGCCGGGDDAAASPTQLQVTDTGQVIAGWDQGLVGMRVGGTRTLIIPSSLAYGSAGAGGALIPPNAALVFTVDLLAVQQTVSAV